MPSFWPHIWAIPLTLLVGFAIGWALRSRASETHSSDRPHRPRGLENDHDLD